MKRKILITFLVTALLVTTFVPFAAFAGEGEASDVSHAKAVQTLKRLDMLGEEFSGAEKIKFGEFLGLAMKLTGITGVPASTSSPYSDVTDSEKYYSEVIHATNMGIVSGYGDGTLGYAENITSGRASKILVSILGYEPHAIVKGGYPAGYTIVAGNIGVFDELALDANSPLTWDQAAQMVYNCLEIEILQPESYPTESYVTVDGENPLTKWMKVLTVEGTVTSNAITNVMGGEGEEAGYVTIDNVRYLENGCGASKYVGCKVNAYYKEESSAKRTLLMVSLDENYNEWEIPSEALDDSTTKEKVYYYEDGSDKAKYVTVEDAANIFYNFKKYTSAPTDNLFKPENGAVRLVDSDGNKKADAVYVTESETYVVEEVRPANGFVKDLYNREDLRLDTAINDELVFTVLKDGVEVSVSDIKVNDVLTVTKSEDGNYISVEIGYKRARGTLDGMGADYLEIKGEKYNIVKQNQDKFTSDLLGKEITILFDKYLNAAGYLLSQTSGLDYGYLCQIKASGKGLNAGQNAQIMLFTPSGEFITVQTADKVSVNGSSKNESGVAFDGTSLVESFMTTYEIDISDDPKKPDIRTFTAIKNQLIKYKLNDAGEVTEIETARNNCYDHGGTGMEEEGFTLDLDYWGYGKNPGGAEHNFIYKNSGVLGNDYDLKGTIGIQIPNPKLWASFYMGINSWSDLEKAFDIYTPTTDWPNDKRFTDGAGVKLYDVDAQKVASFIITEGATSSVNPTQHLFLVESVGQALDDDGMPGTRLSGMYKGKEAKLFVKTDAQAFKDDPKLLEIKSGDIIRIAQDATGMIVNLFKVYTLYQDAEWLDAQFGKNADKRNISFKNTVRPNREYLLGGDEFAEWVFSNGETGDPGTLRTYPYCFWTGNACTVMHVRTVYMSGSRPMLNHGPLEATGESITEKLVNTPGVINGGFYFYDEANETVRLATKDDLIEDDRYTYVLRSRYGSFEDLIVIKHKEPVLGYWEGYTEGK
ncbi:MAG: S-layer homology domain-containing protein [Clostridia bacterium]|nr:S-layer homology domain-containing protein [Clostridia bacterium]